MMDKRFAKDTIKRIHRRIFQCDLNYELPPKRFGLEQVVLLCRMESDPNDIADCYSLYDWFTYLESFYTPIRLIQKLLCKKDKAFRSQVCDFSTKAGLGGEFNKRTRLSPRTIGFKTQLFMLKHQGQFLASKRVRISLKLKIRIYQAIRHHNQVLGGHNDKQIKI